MGKTDKPADGDRLSDQDLEAILARSDAATPGPWESWVEGRDHHGGDSFIRRGGFDDSVDDLYITPWRMEDQDFIAAARQDIPVLVAEILRLRERSRDE